jgi:hypothetical protein
MSAATVTATIVPLSYRDARVLEHIKLAESVAAIHGSGGDPRWDIDDFLAVTTPKLIKILDDQPTAPVLYIAKSLHNVSQDLKRKRIGRPRVSRRKQRVTEQEHAPRPLSERVELGDESTELAEQASPWVLNDERICEEAWSAIHKLRQQHPLWAELLLRKSTLHSHHSQPQTFEEIGSELGISRHKAGREYKRARKYLQKIIRTKPPEEIAESLSLHEPCISMITPQGFKKRLSHGMSELAWSVVHAERTSGKARFFARQARVR